MNKYSKKNKKYKKRAKGSKKTRNPKVNKRTTLRYKKKFHGGAGELKYKLFINKCGESEEEIVESMYLVEGTTYQELVNKFRGRLESQNDPKIFVKKQNNKHKYVEENIGNTITSDVLEINLVTLKDCPIRDFFKKRGREEKPLEPQKRQAQPPPPSETVPELPLETKKKTISHNNLIYSTLTEIRFNNTFFGIIYIEGLSTIKITCIWDDRLMPIEIIKIERNDAVVIPIIQKDTDGKIVSLTIPDNSNDVFSSVGKTPITIKFIPKEPE